VFQTGTKDASHVNRDLVTEGYRELYYLASGSPTTKDIPAGPFDIQTISSLPQGRAIMKFDTQFADEVQVNRPAEVFPGLGIERLREYTEKHPAKKRPPLRVVEPKQEQRKQPEEADEEEFFN